MKKFAAVLIILLIIAAQVSAKNLTVAMRQEEVGKIKVVEVNADYAVCKVTGETNDIKKGDVVKRGD